MALANGLDTTKLAFYSVEKKPSGLATRFVIPQAGMRLRASKKLQVHAMCRAVPVKIFNFSSIACSPDS